MPLGAAFGFEPPRADGHDTVDTIRAMADGRVRAFVAMGGNFAAAAPDTDATYAALRRCALTVQVSTKLNRSHVECGDTAVILPCLGRTERRRRRRQFVTVEDSMSVVHRQRGPPRPGRARPAERGRDRARGSAPRCCPMPAIDWEGLAADYDRIRDRIEAVIPGFERYNERVRDAGGFVLPHPPRDERSFPTASGKARFTVNPLDGRRGARPAACCCRRCAATTSSTRRSTGSTTATAASRPGAASCSSIPTTSGPWGSPTPRSSTWSSHFADGVERRAEAFRLVSYPVAAGTCAAYFPEANVLVPLGSIAEGSGTPTSKSIVVSFEHRS